MEFYTIVVIVASCFLIFCLVVMGIIMQKMNSLAPFPPIINPCPDNWSVSGNNCVISTNNNIGIIGNNIASFTGNTYGLYDSKGSISGKDVKDPLNGTTSINFGHEGWNKTGASICAQKSWANQYGISWDGVSNNSGC